MLGQWQERIRAAAAAGTALQIRGGGTKAFYGQEPVGEVFDTREWRGIVAYEPSELYISARCGTPLAELEAELTAHDQMLAFEPPHFSFRSGSAATVGGCFAAGLSGPRRMSAGALRDHVLGARLLDGRGELLSFGGTVMKNVAGYDVARLLAGSLGTLGVVVEVTFKVLPRPRTECTVRLELSEAAALAQMNAWGGQALPISATSWIGGLLFVRLSGSEATVETARAQIGGDWLDEEGAEPGWRGIREHRNWFFAGPEPLWRVAVPPTAEPLGFTDIHLIEWGGSLRWYREEPTDDGAPADEAAASVNLREHAAAAGGHATLFRGGDKSVGVFTPLAAPIAAIHRRLKDAFDPARIFNPGRMIPDL